MSEIPNTERGAMSVLFGELWQVGWCVLMELAKEPELFTGLFELGSQLGVILTDGFVWEIVRLRQGASAGNADAGKAHGKSQDHDSTDQKREKPRMLGAHQVPART